MRRNIRRPHGKSAIQHAQQKHKPITRIPRRIHPILPHKAIRRMRLPVRRRHGRAHHYTNKHARDSEEAAKRLAHG